MKSIETVVGEMLMHYCDAIIQAKGKSYSRAGKIWKDQIHVDLANSFPMKKPRSRLRKARAR